MTLDHLIATVPDLRETHARLLGLGFGEAWPPGPFWPVATTSGIALGGANLELVQPDAGVAEPWIDTLVLAPSSLAEGRAFVPGAREVRKEERDQTLLTLRSFPPGKNGRPRTICRNLYPVDPPYPFFLCLYAPLLKARLAPANFATPRGPLVALSLVAAEPEMVQRLFAGSLGSIALEVRHGERPGVEAIRFADGSILTAGDL